ncbi:MAG: hypothetical protein K8W52_29490 [Deltaproteobacteria bacterium]|nr:hypothetical protein [Deltaproteobacteria bacterium]
MSYVHCPSCQRAFDARAQARCPSCKHKLGAAPAAADVEAEIAEATAQLARALARATPAQLAALTTIEPDAAESAASPTERWAAVVVAGLGRAVAEERGETLDRGDGVALEVAPTSAALATLPAPTVGSLAQSLVAGLVAALIAPLRASRAPDVARRAAAVVERVRAAFA